MSLEYFCFFCNYLIFLADTFQTISLWLIYSSTIGKLLKQAERPFESVEISPPSHGCFKLFQQQWSIFSSVGWKSQCGRNICYRTLQKSPRGHCSLLCRMSQKMKLSSQEPLWFVILGIYWGSSAQEVLQAVDSGQLIQSLKNKDLYIGENNKPSVRSTVLIWKTPKSLFKK